MVEERGAMVFRSTETFESFLTSHGVKGVSRTCGSRGWDVWWPGTQRCVQGGRRPHPSPLLGQV